MNGQRSVLSELTIIAVIIALISVLIWNIDLTPSPPKAAAPQPTATVSQPAHTAATKETDEKWKEGRQLFKINCASCHNPLVAQTGPALIGVSKRWDDAGSFKNKTGAQWLKVWIKNWHDAVDAGYPYAQSMANYSASEMAFFPRLKDEEIDKILWYVDHSAVQ